MKFIEYLKSIPHFTEDLVCRHCESQSVNAVIEVISIYQDIQEKNLTKEHSVHIMQHVSMLIQTVCFLCFVDHAS